jgi:pimeloyl-ACP methyl ester carboxylesterase
MTMDAEAQQAFLQAYGQTSDIPLGVFRPVETVADEEILLTMDANPLARGEEVASLATTFHVDSVDGLAESTALPPPAGFDQAQWRQTLDRLAMNPPADVAELRQDLTALTGGVLDPARLDELAAADGNALPAVLNLVQTHPPAVTFSEELNLSILPGGRGVPATYESLTYDPATHSVVVDTSVNRFIRGNDRSPELGVNYGIADMPMTVRIPLPEGAPIDWDHPTPEQLALLNRQIQEIGSTSVFLHGYQSDRRVWETDMQRWMELSPEPTIGIAFGGMGSEGDFLGSGAAPLTPRQYAFSTMEALDSLGLYGRELNLYGHSMGGAALLQMGLATDEMVAAGATRPDVNYVLLQPAPSGDSVPFLTERWTRGLIAFTNHLGSQSPAGNFAASLLNGAGAWFIVGHDLIPGAPGYIHEVHQGFAGGAGFPQLMATAGGLMFQGEPDPAAVRAFMERNHVLVVAGSQDRIVSTEAVRGIFDGQVFEVAGNHYAHLPSDIAEENRFTDVERRVEEFLAEED